VLRHDADRYGIKQATQDRIWEAANELGYVPNLMAKSLKTGQTGLIAFVGRRSQYPIRRAIEDQIEMALQNQGYRVLALHGDLVLQTLSAVEGLQPGAYVVCSPLFGELTARFDQITKRGVPVILADEQSKLNADQIFIDRYQVAYRAAEHLISMGHRRITYLLGEAGEWVVHERRKGFSQALADAGMSPEEGMYYAPDSSIDAFQQGYRAIHEGHVSPKNCTAVMATSDHVAMGMLRACYERGIRVPDDLSIIGSENLPESQYLHVPLTTVEFPIRQIVDRVVKQLNGRLKGDHSDAVKVPINPEIVVRESVRQMHLASGESDKR